MGTYSDLAELEHDKPRENVDSKRVELDSHPSATKKRSTESTHQSTSQSASRLTTRHTSRPASRQTGGLSEQLVDTTPILPRPKSFYITEGQDERIDAVAKALKRHPRVQKLLASKRLAAPDRSTVMRLYLQSLDPSDNELISRLVDRLLNQSIDWEA